MNGILSSHEQALQSADESFNQQQVSAGQDYDSAVADAITTMQATMDSNAAAFSSALQQILTANQQAVATADSAFDSATSTATAVFTAGQQSANMAYQSPHDQASSLRNSTVQAANVTLQATLQANQSVYQNADGSSSGFDPAVASSDPGFQSWLLMAEATWHQ